MIRRLLRRPAHPAAPTLPSLAAYAKWAPAYQPEAHNALMAAEDAAMRAVLPPLGGLTVVDLACGTGRYARIAHASGAARVIAADNSAPMVRVGLAAGAIAAPVTLPVQSDLDHVPLASASVDGVICGLALGHLPDMRRAVAEIARILRPDGWAAISDVHPYLFLNGAQRTFTADGRLYAVEHTVHLLAEYVAAGRAGGLRLADVREPRLTADGAPVALVMLFTRGA